MKRPVFAFIAAASIIASCTTAKITFFFKDASYQKQPRKVLVLAVVRKPVARRLVEDTFTRAFRARGIEAALGYAVFSGDDLPATAVLDRELKAGGFDALLLMRLVDPKREIPAAPGTSADPRFKGWPVYYSACRDAAYSPNYTLEDKYALAETSLYDSATEKLIWIAQSETWLGGQNAQIMVWDFVDVMMGSLQKNTVVPPEKKK